MDLSGQRESENVQDARGGKAGLAVGGGIVALLLTLVGAYFGVDLSGISTGGGGAADGPGKDDGYKKFSAQILGSTEDVWAERFREDYGKKYRPAGMKLFSEGVQTRGCGYAPSAVGPFYCPGDQTVFLDPTFFKELEQKLGGSKAEFSQAYVIAHEVGHHVQHLLGYDARMDEFSGEGKNASIRLELQADYLAGVWANHAKNLKVSEADVREAIRTAKAIGDNRIEEKMQGKSWPESFTHGSDEQRSRWFLDGFKTGDASKAKLDKFFDKRTPPLKL